MLNTKHAKTAEYFFLNRKNELLELNRNRIFALISYKNNTYIMFSLYPWVVLYQMPKIIW